MKKRFLSVITALCLCLSLLPTAALAEGEGDAGSSPKALTSDTISVTASSCTYTGEEITATVTVKDSGTTLVEGVDYTLSGNTETQIGIYTLTVTGMGNYAGTVTRDWEIWARGISGGMVSISGESYVGGIAGMLYTNHGKITSCHSVGSVTSSAQTFLSAVAGYVNPNLTGAMSNNYYLNGFDKYASQKTAEEFANGTVLTLLGETDWAQDTSHPVLHSWAYSADGSTITARCTEAGCTAADTLTIRAPEGAVYDGAPKKAALNAASLGGMTSLGAIAYEKQRSADRWSDATVTAPVDAGTYRASIRVGNATARVVFTVAKAALSGEAGYTAITQSAGIDTSVGAETNILSFDDALEVSPYALEAMQWAVGAGVLRGADGKLMPTDTCTRGQIMTMLYRLLGA